MSKIAVIYSSPHHGNTKKVIDKMAKVREIDIFKPSEIENIDFSEYDYIGFASGIYYHNFAKPVIKAAESIKLKENQKIFAIYTCGVDMKSYTKSLKNIVESKNGKYIGSFSCKGYDTYGPFKLIGGVAKGHPDEKDFEEARKFITKI